nr:unnamed protein product [Spirometra erinaceieuropaei]
MRVGQDWLACGSVYGIQYGHCQGRIDTPDEIIRVKADRREVPRRDRPQSASSPAEEWARELTVGQKPVTLAPSFEISWTPLYNSVVVSPYLRSEGLTTGKRPRQPVTATGAAGQSRPSRLFFISDKLSGFRFLVDTGAEISAIPPSRFPWSPRPPTWNHSAAREGAQHPDLLQSKEKPIELPPAAHSAFEAAKKALADATLLHHFSPDPHAQLILTTDASNSAVGAALHQQRAQRFFVHINHKPLTYVLKATPDRYSPREILRVDYASQLTADFRYVRGSDNVVAHALSRPNINTLTSDFDLAKLADLQSGNKSTDDLRSTTSLQLRDAPPSASPGTILCDWSTGTPRPVVPLSYRKSVFDHFHSLSHPGIRASRKLIAARFFWPNMNSDIALWTRQCLACQKNKVHRHTFSPTSTFAVPDVRFHHVHLDLVGPLPPSQGYTHILTAVDRFKRWSIAVPISDTPAENIVMVFLTHWISTVGVPATLTTDCGSQFQSGLFREFTKLLGCAHITATAYHPASNGLVQCLHHKLKSALMSQTESASWSDNLSLALMGIRSSVKEDIQCTAAELVYGTPLRLPDEFVRSSTTNINIPRTFVQQLKQRMAQLRPTPTRLTSKRVFVHEDLKSVPFVFVRHATVRKFLCSLCDGPYKVLQRMDK